MGYTIVVTYVCTHYKIRKRIIRSIRMEQLWVTRVTCVMGQLLVRRVMGHRKWPTRRQHLFTQMTERTSDVVAEFSYRTCDVSGQWMSDPSGKRPASVGWTDYSQCYPEWLRDNFRVRVYSSRGIDITSWLTNRHINSLCYIWYSEEGLGGLRSRSVPSSFYQM